MSKLDRRTKTERVLIYGAPFTGKSTLAGQLAEHFNLIWVDLENGHDVLLKLPQEWQDRIELVDLPDSRSFPIAIQTCLAMVKKAVEICNTHGKVSCSICKRQVTDRQDYDDGDYNDKLHNKYFTDIDLNSLSNDTIVVFDSGTQLTNSAIAHITKDQDEDYKLKQDDWGNLGKLLDVFLSHLQVSKYHVVLITHDTEAEQENGKTKLFPVMGTRNFSRNTAKYFKHVVYAEVKNRKHTFTSSTMKNTNIIAGSTDDIDVTESLLQIFKPELYPDTPVSNPTKQIKKSEGGDTASILARLKSKHK